MSWVVVPNRNYDGIPQGYRIRTGDEYVSDLRKKEIEQRLSVDVSTNEIRQERVKLSKLNPMKQLKRDWSI